MVGTRHPSEMVVLRARSVGRCLKCLNVEGRTEDGCNAQILIPLSHSNGFENYIPVFVCAY